MYVHLLPILKFKDIKNIFFTYYLLSLILIGFKHKSYYEVKTFFINVNRITYTEKLNSYALLYE